MLKKNQRVRFIDQDKDKEFGVLIIFNIKGDIVTIAKGDFYSYGENMMNVKRNEIKPV